MVADATGASGNPPPLPGEGGATEVHELRNGAQHRGRAPSDEELAACRGYTHLFLSRVVESVWGVTFDTLAQSGAIDEQTCRERMEGAEAALASGDYLGAARAARSALARASALATRDQEPHFALKLARTAMFGTEDRELAAVRAQVRSLTLGLDPALQSRLARLTGNHSIMGDGSDKWRDPEEAIDLEGAEWAIAYCTDAIVSIEERFGPLRPIGA